MKISAIALAICLSLAISSGASKPVSDRQHIVLNRTPDMKALPFSDGVLVGNTLYVAGHVGIDPKTNKPAAKPEDEAQLAMEGVKQTVEAAGMTMDDLVSVQVFCSDLSLYDTFNTVYRTYFHGGYPGRAFIGNGTLFHGARFEVLGVAVKTPK
jgi:2-iminobutanoate/2-iminopropanoate deaminase